MSSALKVRKSRSDIEVSKVHQDDDEKMEIACAICMSQKSECPETDYFVSTVCGHLYHYLCIKATFENSYKFCPLCYEPITMENLTRLYGIEPPSKNGLSHSACDYKFKIVILGDSGVGKSCLLQRYADNVFVGSPAATIGLEWRKHTMTIGGKSICLNLWDTVGQERHRSIITNYVRDGLGALIVFDLTSPRSFDSIQYWFQFIKSHGLENCVQVLVGNKSDLTSERKVLKSKAMELAQKMNVSYFETSAKNDYNIEATFRTVAAQILENDELLKYIEEKNKRRTIRIDKADESASSAHLLSSCFYVWQKAKGGWAYFKNLGKSSRN